MKIPSKRHMNDFCVSVDLLRIPAIARFFDRLLGGGTKNESAVDQTVQSFAVDSHRGEVAIQNDKEKRDHGKR
jgi:hypothetical protein